MKYVYVCVSEMSDYYLEQTFASIVTLKKHTPNASVSLLIDDITHRSLTLGRERINDICDEVVVKTFDKNISKKIRSRLLKTNMRDIVKGDFLYIDGDTFIFRDLSEIDSCPYSLAGVQDKHCRLSENEQFFTHSRLKIKICAEKKFLEDETYINGGVIWVKDTKENRNFFAEWNEKYVAFEKIGITQDMPSLSWVNYSYNHLIKELDGTWNCQLGSGAGYFYDVRILHYFASHLNQKSLVKLFEKIRQYGFDNEAEKYVLDNYKQIAFDFGPCSLLCGDEYNVKATAFYRCIVYLYRTHSFLFNFFEKIFSLGRGRGFYIRSK